jgi:hypothetical protein
VRRSQPRLEQRAPSLARRIRTEEAAERLDEIGIHQRSDLCADIVAHVGDVGLLRSGGQVNYGDPGSSSFVEESLQAVGGLGISIHRSLVAAGERPAAS